MMRKYYKIILIFALGCNAAVAQQEAYFSHYMFNHQVINAAYAGARGRANFTSVFRTQWTNIEGAPQSQSLSYNAPITEKNLGYGLSILNDRIGPINSTSLDVDFSYHLPLNEKQNRLSVGLKLGVLNHFINLDDIITQQPGDAAFVLENDRVFLPNIGFGMYYYSQKFYAGLAVPRVIENKTYGLERHYYFMLGGLLKPSKNVMLKPSMLLRQVRKIGAYDFSLLMIYNERLWLGGQIRNHFNGSAFQNGTGTRSTVLMGIQLGKSIALGYAYGVPSQNASGINQVSHELYLRYDIIGAIKGYLRSPRFF